MEYPITPPPELVQQWTQLQAAEQAVTDHWQHIATQAAQWGADQQLKLDAEQIAHAYQAGADQELEACCEWLAQDGYIAIPPRLRAARRPKPPSQADLGLGVLAGLEKRCDLQCNLGDIRRALERLKELEALPND